MPCTRYIDSSSTETLKELHLLDRLRPHMPNLAGTLFANLMYSITHLPVKAKNRSNYDKQGTLCPRATDTMEGPGPVPKASAQTDTPVDEPSDGLAGAEFTVDAF